ncbi:hypothetical protein BS50DRAFT_152296 [Corynespora cassiicola Philippines]|uniref:Uncharacterized protein n=1 Tax=Corynespora cassiicola Philippines TaxID=1448308 RepID=A0A2T2N7T6_CORCC|nr:hypothetical protein BS50DRAFT_152296 [Corynespora cassiicola Philippines]
MRWSEAVLVGLRLLVVIVALGVVGIEAWGLQTINDIQARGDAVLGTVQLEQAEKEEAWRDFFRTVAESQLIIWITVATAAFSFLVSLIVLLSIKVERMRITPYVLIPLEFLSMFAMATTFGFSLNLAIDLTRFGGATLDAGPSGDLAAFAKLSPRILGHAIGSGVGTGLLLLTSISALVSTCRRAQEKNSCSFEPTASALGMGHGYAAVTPRAPRSNIPTIYDPEKPMPEDTTALDISTLNWTSAPSSWPLKEDEQSFAKDGAVMGHRDSQLSERSRADYDEDISGPLGLEAPLTGQQTRPARPWSEAPKRNR